MTKVERGYNVYEANCARCHGEQGEGGIGPVLNRQDKLFDHLNENYLKNVLTVGGRYVCGDPKSLMPVWADTRATRRGRSTTARSRSSSRSCVATNDTTYTVRDEHLLDPKVDPVTGEVLTFKGWRDPNYEPAPAATPYPDCWKDEFASGGSARRSVGGAVRPHRPTRTPRS